MKLTAVSPKAPFGALACLALVTFASPMGAQGLQIATLAGSAGNPGSADGTGSAATFNGPAGIAVDPTGTVYVSNSGFATIRKVTQAGVVTTFAGVAFNTGISDGTGSAARFEYPAGMAFDPAGNLYVADSAANTIRKITPAGVVTTIAGTPFAEGSNDGNGANARFLSPVAVAADTNGNVFVTDADNRTIRKITPAGVVTTFAGVAGSYANFDGTGSAARFELPEGIAIDAHNVLYVADYGTNTIRRITPNAVVTTLAGSGAVGSADGTGAGASFNHPRGIAVDASGTVYVADTGNNTIRRITPAGVVTTLAGTPGATGTADGAGAAASFNGPQGTAVDAAGNVYVDDTLNDTVRRGVETGAPYIGTPPLTQTAQVGMSATLSAAASSTTAPTYQWSLNGAPLAGATSPSLTLKQVQLSDEGVYSVAVTNPSGTTVASAYLTPLFVHGSTYGFGSWSSSTALPAGTSFTAVAYDGIRFLAVGLDGTAYSSVDGTGWTASASNGPPGQSWGQLNSVIAIPGRGLLVAVGNEGAIVAFASRTYGGTQEVSGTVGTLTGIAEGGPSLVAVGFGGTCLASDLGASSWKPSATGTTSDLNAVAYGNGRFVAVGKAGAVVTSPDGSTWSAHPLPQPVDLYGIAFGAHGFVAAGANGSLFTSADGSSWTAQASPTQATLVRVAYGDGVFVAVGLSGAVLTSVDQGTTWLADASGTGARLSGIALGNDTFVAVGDAGTVALAYDPSPSRIINLSARSAVGTGDNILIAGFALDGELQVLLRGIGPTLAQFGVTGALAQPKLTVLGSEGTVGTDTSWGGGALLSGTFARVGAFSLAANSADSALQFNLGEGTYTSQLSGQSSSTGVGLAEIYDASAGNSGGRLVNISARAPVGTGGNILIAGFVITGDTPLTVVIRGVGPTLATFGVSSPLAAPQLILFDAGNTALQSNSAWGGSATLAQAFSQVGAFALPSGSPDAAILVTLPPGSYTAELTGVGNATGVGLAEVYEVQ